MSTEIISRLNVILRNELTGINQYFLHARLLKHWGYAQLADAEYKKSIDEMKHADQLIQRILELGGIPHLENLHPLNIGESVNEILHADLKLETLAVRDARDAVIACEAHQDAISAAIVERIHASEHAHFLFLESQIERIDSGEPAAYEEAQT